MWRKCGGVEPRSSHFDVTSHTLRRSMVWPWNTRDCHTRLSCWPCSGCLEPVIGLALGRWRSGHVPLVCSGRC